MTFGKRLTELRKQAGYSTRNEFAKKINIPSTTLRNYETDAREPGHSFLMQISNIFNVSIDYLLGITDEKERTAQHKLKTSEYAHIEKYRTLDSYGKNAVDSLLNIEYERCQVKEENSTYIPDNVRSIDYYMKFASAGSGQVVFDDTVVERITIPDKPEYKRVAYAIGVNGRSMEPLYCDGDMLLVEPTVDIQIGEIGIFIVDGEAYVKKLGKGELISLNPDYDNVPLTEYSSCMGRVVDKISNQE